MQGIIQDFLIWLLKFLTVSAGILVAARAWRLSRRKRHAASGTQPNAAKPNRNSSAGGGFPETLPWLSNPLLLRMVRSVAVAALLGLVGTGLYTSKITSWIAWCAWGGAAFVLWGLLTLWLRRVRCGRMELNEMRRLADDLELAALRLSIESNPEAALGTAFPQIDRACSRCSPASQEAFRRFRSKAQSSPEELRRVADAVHEELSRRALEQARQLSRWGKYPLLAGGVPLVCFLLVAPLTELALDQILRVPPSADLDGTPSAVSGNGPASLQSQQKNSQLSTDR